MPYTVERVDLGQLGAAPQELIKPGVDVTQVHVLAVAGAAVLEVQLGRLPRIPVYAGFWTKPCDPQDRTQGVYVAQPAGATVGEAVLLVWTGAGESGGNPS